MLYSGKLKGYSFFIAGVIALLLIFSPAVANAVEEEAGAEFETLHKVLDDIIENYVEEVDIEKLERGAIRGMLEELDIHSQYLTPHEFEDFQVGIEGTFGGVGMRLEKVGEYPEVLAPLQNTPAERAGVKAGDKILEVDGVDIKDYSLRDVVELIRGEPDTFVDLTIDREGERFTLTLEREVIQLDLVESDIEDGIGYIRISTFSAQSVSEFRDALSELTTLEAEGLILDLRNNPGGYLRAALNVASTFLGNEEYILHIVSRGGEESSYWSTTDGLDIPVVILINGGSASGSEIVAGAVQDNNAGKLVGTETAGKASVQTVRELADGSAYKVTTAKYLTPNKTDIDQKGITPDYTVQDPAEQLAKAKEILKGDYVPTEGAIFLFELDKDMVKVNGEERSMSAASYMSDGNFMAPLRIIGEALGGEVFWSDGKSTVNLEGTRIELTPGSSTVVIDGEEIEISTPVEIKNGTLFVPLRFMSTAIGGSIDWTPQTGQVELTVR